MHAANDDPSVRREERAFLFLLILVSVGFAWIIRPFYGAVLWATVVAIVFMPLHRRLLRAMSKRPNGAALLTVAIVLAIVILPLTLLGMLLLQEASATARQLQSGGLDVHQFVERTYQRLPAWGLALLDRFGLTSLAVVEARLSAFLTGSIAIAAGWALSLGQNALSVLASLGIALYLMFFLLRDGEQIVASIQATLPLRAERQRELFARFTSVVRATVKGDFVVAAIQGSLGGLIFWLLGVRAPVLWAALMALLSLLPAIGASIVWLPVALWFLVAGPVWKGVVLIAYGLLIIGLMDNILRPILVGKETRMPDYVVLISTVGGLAVAGVHGFVLGPLIAALFLTVWGMFRDSRAARAGAAP